ncbi:MAG: hypothetical protein H7296_00655 [Bacteroidia bacterium]|nr:hypothetical protein [Bacteroidia bacterium]
MALIGGTKKMRGYYEERFRDKDLTMLQGKYSVPLFWRSSVVAFAGCGLVSYKLINYHVSNLKYN